MVQCPCFEHRSDAEQSVGANERRHACPLFRLDRRCVRGAPAPSQYRRFSERAGRYIRCRLSIPCWSSVLAAAVRIPGCCTAVQIARASAASVLLVCTMGRRNDARNSTTSCPSALILRAQQCPLPHASNATRPAGRCARNPINSSRPKSSIHDLTSLGVDPVHSGTLALQHQSICRSIHCGPSVPQVVVSKLHFGTSMPFGPGGPLLRY